MKFRPAFLVRAAVVSLALLASAPVFSASASPSAPAMSTLAAPATAEKTPRFVLGPDAFLLDGKTIEIRCGEIHLARVPPEYWRHRLQMIKAMGLNSVCAYLFWNFHEQEPGKVNWTGWQDAAEFCRIAQEEGLWVILRPGPYVCAEWEMGGLPWWLIKTDANTLRTRDPAFMAASRAWLAQVGRQLAPLQIDRGGPILMVQVENEYGYFGKDAAYLQSLRDTIREVGFTVPLFACNPPFHLNDTRLPDVLPVVNFGSDAKGAFKALRNVLPKGPLMAGEFYPGWFDSWGAAHNGGNLAGYLSNLDYMLKNKYSFSIYMAHGGTSFGLWAGAIGPKPGSLAFRPDTTSYDYDAPISEPGWETEKFKATRDLISKYLEPGETLPAPPARKPVIAIPAFTLTDIAPVFANLPPAISDTETRPMEKYNQGHGCIVYRTTIPAGPEQTLRAASVRDFAWVYLNGKEVGRLDRRYRVNQLVLPARTTVVTLDLLVEAMGRINFSQENHDRKGLHGPVTLDDVSLKNWQIYSLGLDAPQLAGLKWNAAATATGAVAKQPAFWRGEFQVPSPADTFLDVSTWGKGVVWINGQCLGRFWNIGPTQTMFLPGPWLKTGRNEVIVLDLIGPEKPGLAGLTEPVLNRWRPELDFKVPSLVAQGELLLKQNRPVQIGSFPNDETPHTVMFSQPATGRQMALEMLSSQDGKPFAAIAELDLLDEAGQPLSRAQWTVAYVDSEELNAEEAPAAGAIDGVTGQRELFWHSEWSRKQTPYPHTLIIDLGAVTRVSGLRYTPRTGKKSGRIKDYRVYVFDELIKQ